MIIKTIRSLQELETLRACWEGWQKHPNSDFAHFQLVCRLRPEVKCPHVTIVERNGKPCALLAARLERTRFVQSVGYFTPVRIPARVLTVLYQGLLGQVDEEMAEALVRHLWSLLASGEADAVSFHQLPEHSALLRALLVHGPRYLCEKRLAWSTHWEMVLPDEPGFQLKKLQSKHRSWIRGRQRKLESAFRGKVSWRWMSSFEDVPDLCARLEWVAARTYQRGLRAGFVDDEEHRQRFSLFAKRGQLRVHLLEIEGKVRAFWIGQVYRGVFHSEATGYDLELSGYEPGTLVFVRMIDELVQEGVRKLDFGLGDALYKQRFGDRFWREATMTMFAPTAKGLSLRSCLKVCSMLDSAGRRMLQRTALLDRLKTGWRRRLARAGPEVDKK